MRTTKILKLLILVPLLAACTRTASAQDTTGNKDIIVISRPGMPFSGTITDAATKKGLAGIRVQVPNFSAAITDSTGQFALKVPSYKSTIVVEGEGYNSRSIPLKGRRTVMVALLDESHTSYNEELTLPIGPKSRLAVTEAVNHYHVNAAWDRPMEMADALLQGKAPGLHVIRRSGAQGVGANMYIRGFNSLYATNKPLIVIDNMLFDANEYGESIIANNYTNPMALIDVKDIDHVTVLKDASSIYGTKGANGAIIITTERPRTHATHIDFVLNSGFNQAPSELPVMNAGDYRLYLEEVLQSKGLNQEQIKAQPYMNDDPANPLYAQYHFNTNWQRRVLANSFDQNCFVKIRGGDNIAMYGLSMGFTKNNGIVKQTDLTRYNTRFNAEFNFTKRFAGRTNLSFSYNEQQLKDQGMADRTAPLYLSLIKAPFLNDREVNDKGVESPNLAERDTLGVTNPSAIIEHMRASNKYYRFYGSFDFGYELFRNVKASTLVGLVFDKMRENFFIPRKGITNDTLSNAIADSRMGTQVKRLFTIYNDTRIEYKKGYKDIHQGAARLGMRFQQNKAGQHYALGFNSATDDLTSVQNGVNALRQVGGGIGDWNWLNFYFNTEYAFRNKIFLSLNAAMDGSSRFGPEAPNGIRLAGRRFPVMPAVGVSWLLSSEDFMANVPIDLLKLRAGWSITGNDDIGNYNSGHTYISQNLLGAQGLVRRGLANPALQWETVSKGNLGLDLALWHDRVYISLDAYQHRTSNMLVYHPLAPLSGFEYALTNDGSMENRGLEASVHVRLVNRQQFTWDIGINAAMNKNKIGTVPDSQLFTAYAGATILTAAGKPASQFYGHLTNGVFASDAEAAALAKRNPDGSVSSFKGGDVRFLDLDDNKVIDDGDRSVIGDPNPDYTGAFSNRIKWKRFELNALFTFSKGGDIYNYLRYRLEAASGTGNQLASVNNRWRGEGHITDMPRASWGDPTGNNRFSDRWIEDGSYLRLRHLSLQYDLPVHPNGFVKNFTLYGSAVNVFTLTRYKGYDPEFSASPAVFTQGIDTGLDPLYRTVTLGVRLGL
ncbi:SusC/RagA family TonB-linked outer membrane protein [Longitalea arenae]|uniref:SusC/RagA family TonB-linked outer membrane protein n=1 Tax=Longitalea arenae TaxID=2812558 RepID=UPI00196743F3|nr:SusC/RagA family TonB-linked outer membrane protein [Longitalea arenae]